jgi:uncharacterized membrane protein
VWQPSKVGAILFVFILMRLAENIYIYIYIYFFFFASTPEVVIAYFHGNNSFSVTT